MRKAHPALNPGLRLRRSHVCMSMNLLKQSATFAAVILAAVALAQELGIPDSLAREQKRIDRFLPGSTKDRADDVASDLYRAMSSGNGNNVVGELGRLLREMPGRTPTTVESDVIGARALATTLKLQDREVKEVLKHRDQIGRIRQWLQREQDEISRRARQLGYNLREVTVKDVDKPSGWPMNEPIHAARSGVPIVAWNKDELAQTYRNNETQLQALVEVARRADRLESLNARRSRIIDGLDQFHRRTSRLSDDVLRKIKL
jgi:hypothetical protein